MRSLRKRDRMIANFLHLSCKHIVVVCIQNGYSGAALTLEIPRGLNRDARDALEVPGIEGDR